MSTTNSARYEEIRERVAKSRAKQGLSPTLTDVATIERIAAIFLLDPSEDVDRRPEKRDSVVYFAIVGDQMKIGTTVNIHARFGGMLPPQAEVYFMSGARKEERSHHETFRDERIGNTEWFRYSDRLRDYVASLVASGVARQHRAPVH